MSQVLNELLDEGRQYDPLYVPSFNADHLPMTLVAMHELGASEEALRDYQARYRGRLRSVEQGADISSVAEGRGRIDAFRGLREVLMKEIAQEGVDCVIRTYLPELLPSLAAGAFHPMIRLGFAITVNHETEVASALAYWMTSSLNPVLKPALGDQSLAQAINALEPVALEDARFSAGLYALVDQGLYPHSVNTTLEDCAAVSLCAYLGTRNFFALHFVTATQAARVCSPFVETTDLIAALTAGIQAGYLIVGAPNFDKPLPPPKQLDEEHNLKYMYACSQEYQFYGDVRYRDEMVGFVETGLVPDWIKIPD